MLEIKMGGGEKEQSKLKLQGEFKIIYDILILGLSFPIMSGKPSMIRQGPCLWAFPPSGQ